MTAEQSSLVLLNISRSCFSIHWAYLRSHEATLKGSHLPHYFFFVTVLYVEDHWGCPSHYELKTPSSLRCMQTAIWHRIKIVVMVLCTHSQSVCLPLPRVWLSVHEEWIGDWSTCVCVRGEEGVCVCGYECEGVKECVGVCEM